MRIQAPLAFAFLQLASMQAPALLTRANAPSDGSLPPLASIRRREVVTVTFHRV